MPNDNAFNFDAFADIFKDVHVNGDMKQPTIKDIADRFRVVMVKCPCCSHTIKFKVKL